MRLAGKTTIVLGALTALAVGTLTATRVRLLNLQEMVQSADRIFWGVCERAEEKSDPQTGFQVTEYTFKVKRSLKGVENGQTIVFRQLQTTARRPGALNIPGIPRYQPNQAPLIFLAGDSRLGLTSPVGLEQGLFRVQDQGGRLTVINSLRNSNLDHNLAKTDMRSAGLSKHQADLLSKNEAIPLDDFVSMVDLFNRSGPKKVR